jgi:hypothetical protein
MLIRRNLQQSLPTLSRTITKTCNWGVGVLGVRFETIDGYGLFSLDKVKTHPTHPLGEAITPNGYALWSHTRDIHMIAFPDRLVYRIPIHSEQDRFGFNTLLLSVATPEYVVPK